MYRKALETGISLHRGLAGKPGVGSFTRDFHRRIKEVSGNGASLSVGALRGEAGGRTPLLGTLKDRLIKTLEMGVCFHGGPVLGNMGGTLLS